MQKFQGPSLPGNENGATLVVALIMLVLISLIGVSSLRSAAVVEKMSANDYQKNLTFQASESAASVALEDETLISKAMISGIPETTPIATNLPHMEAKVTYKSTGAADTFGSSLGDQGFSGQRIMVTSSSYLSTDPSVQSTTVHGIVRLVPGGAGG